jgi:hypothetical protein
VTEQSEKKRIDLKTTQVAAGSMASVTSAVAASQLGVGGTLVGAGVGSVVGTVAGAFYEHYLDRTQNHVRSVIPRRTTDGGEAETIEAAAPAPTAVDGQVVDADTDQLPVTSAPLNPLATPPGDSQETWRWLRSRRFALALSAAAGLGIALVALTGFEAFTGQPVGAGSSGSGTSIGHVFGGGSASDSETDPSQTPTPNATDESTPASPPASSPAITSPTPTPQPSTPSTTEPAGPQGTPADAG